MTRQSDRFSRVAVLLAALALLSVVESACWAQAGQPGQNATAPGAAPAGGDAVYRQQVSYMLGQNVGRDLKQNEIQCDIQSFMAGVADALSGAQPKWTEQQLATCRSRFEEEMRSKMMNRMQSAADTNKKAE